MRLVFLILEENMLMEKKLRGKMVLVQLDVFLKYNLFD